MYRASFSSKFLKDVKSCKRKHWDIDALNQAIRDVLSSDTVPLALAYRDHALAGNHSGYRALHVQSSTRPPAHQWVLVYKLVDGEIGFTRTGSHDVYHAAF